MHTKGSSIPAMESCAHSQVFQRTVSGLTDIAVAFLDTGSSAVALGTVPDSPLNAESVSNQVRVASADCLGASDGFRRIELTQEELDALYAYGGNRSASDDWRVYECRYKNGYRDRVAVHLPVDRDEAVIKGFLSMIWPVLREDCLSEALGQVDGNTDEALLWMISSKIDMAVMVFNTKGMMLKANSAAHDVLKAGRVLRPGRQGIECRTTTATRALRSAIADCVQQEPEESETVLFLDSEAQERPVPLTLSRVVFEGRPTDMVVGLMPAQPDPKRIRMLAKKMGLTRAEARVASYLQLGLSNREAAEMAGLKEQTFATYTKRVLNKLNVSHRAEVAQLLTWQAQGGRTS